MFRFEDETAYGKKQWFIEGGTNCRASVPGQKSLGQLATRTTATSGMLSFLRLLPLKPFELQKVLMYITKCEQLATNRCEQLATNRCEQLATNRCEQLATNRCEQLATNFEMEKILSTLLNVKARYIAYRVVIATKSTLEKQKGHSTHVKRAHLLYKTLSSRKECPC